MVWVLLLGECGGTWIPSLNLNGTHWLHLALNGVLTHAFVDDRGVWFEHVPFRFRKWLERYGRRGPAQFEVWSPLVYCNNSSSNNNFSNSVLQLILNSWYKYLFHVNASMPNPFGYKRVIFYFLYRKRLNAINRWIFCIYWYYFHKSFVTVSFFKWIFLFKKTPRNICWKRIRILQ